MGHRAPTAGEDDLARSRASWALQVVERAVSRRRDQQRRRRRRRPLELRLRRGERSRRPAPGRRSARRPLQERRGGRDTAAAPARSADCSSSAATSSSGSAAACARARRADRDRAGVRRLGEGLMHGPAVGGSCRPGRPRTGPADGGTGPGHRTRSALRLGRRRGVEPDPEPLGGPPQQAARPRARPRRSAAVVASARERPDAPEKLCSIWPANGARPGSAKPPASSPAVEPAGQLEQSEGVATRLGDDPVPYPLVQPPRARRVQQRAGVAVGQAADHLVPAARPAPAHCSARARRTPAPPLGEEPRATNARICAEAWSSHCASSTRQTSGRSSATTSRLSTAKPDEESIGRRAGCEPNAVARASRCGPGRRRAGPASARTAGARLRTPAPSPIPRLPRGRPGSRCCAVAT